MMTGVQCIRSILLHTTLSVSLSLRPPTMKGRIHRRSVVSGLKRPMTDSAYLGLGSMRHSNESFTGNVT